MVGGTLFKIDVNQGRTVWIKGLDEPTLPLQQQKYKKYN